MFRCYNFCMNIKFDEKTREEYASLYKFLVRKTGGKIKSFVGRLSKDGLPIGACAVSMETTRKGTEINKIAFNVNSGYELEGAAIVTLNNKQCINYNFTDDGFAEIDYPTGAFYIGDVNKFRRHGQGSYTNSEGLEIEGTFENNVAQGVLMLRFTDGETAKGTYFDGKLNGVIKKKIGGNITLTANFNDGKLLSSVYTIEDKGKKLIYKMTEHSDNPFYDITGKADVFIDNKLVYSGQIENAQITGNGTLFISGGKFVGSFKNGLKHGFGTLYDNKGNVIKKGYYNEDKYVGETDMNAVAISDTSSLPSLNIKDNYDIIKLKNAVKNFENSIVGQRNAIEQIANSIVLAYLCEKDVTKPLTSILMTGPTGVGKTETAKQISKHLFGKEPFVVDFGNFKGEHMIASLIGAPSGYKGYDDFPAFLKYIQDNNSTGGVLLFDELDKANEECYSVFMRMLDEGEIISAKNEVFKVNNFIIIGTTNFTANNSRILGFTQSNNNDVKDDLVKNNAGLKKEQVARYNIVVEYEELSKENRIELCKREIEKTVKKVQNINCYTIEFDISDEIVEKIVDNSNASFGAREIKNKASKAITTKLAEFIRKNSQKNLLVKVKSLDDVEIVSKEDKQETNELTLEK